MCYQCNDVVDEVPSCAGNTNFTITDCGFNGILCQADIHAKVNAAQFLFLLNINHSRSGSDEQPRYAEIRDCCGSDNMLSGLKVCSAATETSENKCASMENQGEGGVSLTDITGCCCLEEL